MGECQTGHLRQVDLYSRSRINIQSLSNTLIFKHIQHHNFNIRLLTRALVLRWNPSLAFILWMVKIFILKRDSIVQRRNFALEYFCFCCCWVLFLIFFCWGGVSYEKVENLFWLLVRHLRVKPFL